VIYAGESAQFPGDHSVIVRCNCEMCDSELQFEWWDNDPETQHVCVNMTVQTLSWWRRIGEAVKHVFKPRRYFGYPDKLLLSREEVLQLCDALKGACAR